MARLLCWLFGHRRVETEWVRSPNTVYTHYRINWCSRCHELLDRQEAYFDALSQREMFQQRPM